MLLNTPRPTFLADLPAGPRGTEQTLALMRRLVLLYSRDQHVRETALSLTRDLRPKDWLGEVRALFEYVRDHIRYSRDIQGVETVQIPAVTLDLAQGDCDDKSTLLAALLASVGHKTRFVAVGYSRPGAYSHVFVEVFVDGAWMPLDATVLQPLGWAPRAAVARLELVN